MGCPPWGSREAPKRRSSEPGRVEWEGRGPRVPRPSHGAAPCPTTRSSSSAPAQRATPPPSTPPGRTWRRWSWRGPNPAGSSPSPPRWRTIPGFRQGIQGPALMNDMREQVAPLRRPVRPRPCSRSTCQSAPSRWPPTRTSTPADALIIATGATAKWLGIGKDEEPEPLRRRGLAPAPPATGSSSGARRSPWWAGATRRWRRRPSSRSSPPRSRSIHRRDRLRASKAMQERAFKNPKIHFHWNARVDGRADPDQTLPRGEKVAEDPGPAS